MADQDLLAKFYDIDNLVNIEIEIPEVDWDKLRKAEPHFGWRGTASWMEHPTTKEDIIKWKGHHYDWSKATSVTISGSKYPPSPGRTFKNVGIVKKSFGGSEDKTKPSIKLEFGRLSKEAKETATKAEKEASKKDEADAFALVGASGVTLNNSKQDKSFIRQPLGYEIFRQGGIPYFRCNLAKVIISGPSAADPKVKKQLLQGVFVNVEQAKEPFLRRAFNNDKGNLYETEAWFDLTRESWDKTFNQEGFSGLKNQADLKVAIEQFDKPVAEAKKVIDVEQISRVLALQALIKHWDGYPNNTFIYNDVVPVAEPKPENVKLKIIPSGIDAIFVPDRRFEVKNEGILSALIIGDKTSRERLKKICDESAATFAKNLEANVKFVGRLRDVLKSARGWNEGLAAEVKVVEGELQKVKAGMVNVVI